MDLGLGPAASLLTVIELTAKVAQHCLKFHSAVKNAKPDIERLQKEVERLKTTLDGTQRLLDGPNGERLRTSLRLRDGLTGCSSELAGLETRLRKKLGGKAMSLFGIRALKWPLESKDVERVVRSLEGYRNTLSSALAVDQAAEVLDIGQTIVLSKLPTAKNAAFDSHADEHDAQCHPETRVELLREVLVWAENPGKSKCIYWLNGMAGTGKSTISRTIAQSLANKGDLGGSFFFKRGERDRGNASLLFPTIAAQLVAKEPALASHVRAVIEADPTVTEKNLKEQFEKLVLKPLEKLTSGVADPRKMKRIVLVVDALDECEREADIRVIIRLLSLAKTLSSVLVRAFVTSRPELPIRLGFHDVKGEYQDLILHEIPPPIIEHDITIFLDWALTKIKNDHNCLARKDRQLQSNWPGPNIVQELTNMAVPLFIFAATVCRFIGDPAWCDPASQLKRILEYQSNIVSFPAAGERDKSKTQNFEIDKLDTTYLPVLNQLIVGKTEKEQKCLVEEFRTVVGSIVLLAKPLSVSSLANILGISESIIDRRLLTLHSVLQVPSSPEFPIRMFHLSFRDFLVDPDKRGKNPFWVDNKATHEMLANGCLYLLSSGGRLRRDICDLKMPGATRAGVDLALIESRLPADVRYACLYWVHHVGESGAGITDNHPAYRFLKRHFLHWVEALSLLGRISECVGMIDMLQKVLDPTNGTKTSAFLDDAKRIILDYRSIIDLVPLQTYGSALIFSPTDSVVRMSFETEEPEWIKDKPIIESAWRSCLQTLEGHDKAVNSVAFSHDSMLLASGSDDCALRIWDVAAGAAQQTLNHNHLVESVAFSPDSQLLVSGSRDGIKIWDAITGILQQTLGDDKGHDVHSVVISHDSKLLVSVVDGVAKIYDTITGNSSTNPHGWDS